MPSRASAKTGQACRAQLESDLAYKLFFKANDWDALYDFDEEAAEDAENELEALTSSLTPAPEPEAKVKRTKKGKTASEGEMSEEPSTKRRRVAVSSESSDEDDMGEILRD